MIGGFNLTGFNKNMDELNYINSYARKKNVDYNAELKSVITDEQIDAEKLQNDIFPIKNADIFISHSHADKELAVALKNWIIDKLSMTCFLDSEIWGSADDTLKEIDKFCWKPERNCYDYKERNLTTSYVHVMLCNALMQAMDKCKFTFFINTPNSITAESALKEPKTHSPWLFYELSILKYIQKKSLQKHINFSRGNESLTESVNNLMNYTVDLENLPKLSFFDLENLEGSGVQNIYKKLESYFKK